MESLYRHHRFPPEIISPVVWHYHRFTLNFRDVEDLLAEGGIMGSYEGIRCWCLKFGRPTLEICGEIMPGVGLEPQSPPGRITPKATSSIGTVSRLFGHVTVFRWTRVSSCSNFTGRNPESFSGWAISNGLGISRAASFAPPAACPC